MRRAVALAYLVFASVRPALPQSPPADDRPALASRLPTPAVGEDAASLAYLQAAAQALAAGRTDEAQEAMERAESRALDRSVAPSKARLPDRQPLVQQIAAARAALARGDRADALARVQSAMRDPETGSLAK